MMHLSTLAAVLLSSLPQQGTAEPCRPLPPPSTISAEAQAILAAPEGRAFLDAPATDDAGWRALQRQYEAEGEAYVANALKTFDGTMVRSVMGGVPVVTLLPRGTTLKGGPVLLNLHGGGYGLNGGDASLYSSFPLASRLGIPVITPDYRMAPDHPFPAAVDDTVSVYAAILKDHDPGEVGVYGLSAGGGLVAASVLAAIADGLAPPGAAAMNSPWSDLSDTGDSGITLRCQDPTLPGTNQVVEAMAVLYADGADLHHPHLSPVYGAYTDAFPPSLLITGTRDLFLSNTVRLHTRLRTAGVDADLLVYEGMWHAFWSVPEEDVAWEEITRFFRTHLAAAPRTSRTQRRISPRHTPTR